MNKLVSAIVLLTLLSMVNSVFAKSKPKSLGKKVIGTKSILQLSFVNWNEGLTKIKAVRPKYIKVVIRTPDKKYRRYKWTKYKIVQSSVFGNVLVGTVFNLDNWFTTPGYYSVIIRTPKSKNIRRIKINGKELKTQILSMWGGDKSFIVSSDRYWRSLAGVTLKVLSFSRKRESISVAVINKSNKTIYGGSYTGGAEGYIQVATKQGWRFVYDGGICGNTEYLTLEPKEITTIGQHANFGKANYSNGPYRFVYKYELIPWWSNEKKKLVRDVYVSTVEFTNLEEILTTLDNLIVRFVKWYG